MSSKVLLVEDNEINRELLIRFLDGKYELISTDNGESAIQMSKEQKPDIILMDLSIPVVSGWDAIKILKDDPQTQAIPIIAVTAHAMIGDEEKARGAGADDYVSKPIDFQVLMAKMNTYLEK